MFTSPDGMFKFFVFITDLVVNNALQSEDSGVESLDFSYIDQFSKLILTVVKYSEKEESVFETILAATLIVFTKNHEYHRLNFNQRPFFKLYYNLIYEIQRNQ